jgi:hypothetical protein
MPRQPTGKANCSVLVVSCDRYRDLWTPFFELFRRHWPDCPFPVQLGGNLTGGDKSWSASLRVSLEQIPSDYVLLMLEDFFLDRAVNNLAIEECLQTLHSLNGAAMRLFPNPPSDYALAGMPGVGVLHPLAPFRVSLQACLWNRTKLLALLRDDESSWEFETRGTLRAQAQADGYYCVRGAVIHYQHVVERGEWFWTAARRYGRAQIGCDFQARPVMSPLRAGKKALASWTRRLANRCYSKWLRVSHPQAEFRAL